MDNQQIPKADSKFQKIARKNHRKWKLRLLSKGGQKSDSGGGPYNKKPDYNRAKSAPPGFGGSLEESEKLNEASKFSQQLSDMFNRDQKLRNLFAQEIQKAGGWSQELANQFAKKYGTTPDDVFGSRQVEENFAKLFSQLDFSSFDENDWINFHLLILHQRKPEYLQMRKRALSEMIKAKRWWRDLATDMARTAGLLPEFKKDNLSYPEDTKDGGKVDLLLKKKNMTWDQLAKTLTGFTQLNEIIRKKDGKYCLISKKSKRNLGCYPTRAGAVKREKQVQYFKHLKETIIREELKKVLIEEGLWDDIKSKGKEVYDKLKSLFTGGGKSTTEPGDKTALIIGDSHVDFSPFGKKLENKLKAAGWKVQRAGVGATAAKSWLSGSACGGGKCVKIDELPKGVGLLLICLGTNDGANAVAGKMNQVNHAQRVAGQIATIARNFGAKRTIWILPPWQRRKKSYYTQDAMEYIYNAASSSGVELFDSRPSTKDIVMSGDGDGIHVGSTGGEAWSGAVMQKVGG